MLLPQDMDLTGIFESVSQDLADYFKWKETQKTIRETTPAIQQTFQFSWLVLLLIAGVVVYAVARR